MKKRQWIISGILTLLILLVATFTFQNFRAQKKSTVGEKPNGGATSKSVLTDTFRVADITNEIRIDGRLTAYEKIEIAAEVTGRLVATDKTIKPGIGFREGDVLFEVEGEDARLNLFAQRSTLLNALTQMMPDLKFDYPEAFEKWRDYLDAFEVEKPLRDFPKVTDQKEKYYLGSRDVYTQFYSIKAQEDRLKDYRIYAPFSGVFLNVQKYPGALVTPGSPLASIMNTSRYELVAPINMSDFAYVKPGQVVELSAEGLGLSWSGRVSRISNQIDQMTQSIPVYISVSGRGLRDGMYLSGALDGSPITQAAQIPRTALVDQDHVFILRDSIVRKAQLEVLKRVEESVYVRGLKPTDRVVIDGVQGLFDGQKATDRN